MVASSWHFLFFSSFYFFLNGAETVVLWQSTVEDLSRTHKSSLLSGSHRNILMEMSQEHKTERLSQPLN